MLQLFRLTPWYHVNRVRFLAYSPVEPILVCAVTSSDDQTGALISINMKTMATDVSCTWLVTHLGSVGEKLSLRHCFIGKQHLISLNSDPQNVINSLGFNHNGQLVVTGDVGGMIRVYGKD